MAGYKINLPFKTAKNTTSIEKIGIIAYNGSDTIDC